MAVKCREDQEENLLQRETDSHGGCPAPFVAPIGQRRPKYSLALVKSPVPDLENRNGHRGMGQHPHIFGAQFLRKRQDIRRMP